MRLLAMLLLALLLAGPAHALDVPPLQGRVNDYANMIDPETRDIITGLLKDFESKHSVQIGVLTIPSLEGEVLEAYSLRVANTWALGQKGKDNGVLFLVAKKERKIRLEVGYGLTSILTNAKAKAVIVDSIAPFFGKGDFSTGFLNGTRHIMAIINEGYSTRNREQ